MTAPLLSVHGVKAYYGHIAALKGVDIEVGDGEIVALIGANGAGKSTLMMTIFGNPRAREGRITFAGRDITELATHDIARLQIAQAPEGRRIFVRMTADDMEALEAKMEKDLNVSAIVEPIGGLGTYPTMIYETTNLNYTMEVGAHEWSHNYLTLRPLGINYDTSQDLRTMNETTATIVGQEIGQKVVARYYPELVPPPPAPRRRPTTPAPCATGSGRCRPTWPCSTRRPRQPRRPRPSPLTSPWP